MSASVSSKLRVLTYNVHSCVGTDGKLSIERVARVIAAADPDVVALQELDCGRRLSCGDQAEKIAREVKMRLHFHPVFQKAAGTFGNAILSRFPMKKKGAWALPAHSQGVLFEPRGVLGVEVEAGGRSVHVFNTHLSLWSRERRRQAEFILGLEALASFGAEEPVILCGDFNFSPRSGTYRFVADRLEDTHRALNPRQALTWFSPFPLRRLDYIFKRGPLSARAVVEKRTPLERTASDHLPVITDFFLP